MVEAVGEDCLRDVLGNAEAGEFDPRSWGPTGITAECGWIAGATVKIKTLLQRVDAKDYVDIAALITAGGRLDYALASAREMFGSALQPSEGLKAPVHFEGGDLSTLSPSIKTRLIEAVSNVRALPAARRVSGALS